MIWNGNNDRFMALILHYYMYFNPIILFTVSDRQGNGNPFNFTVLAMLRHLWRNIVNE